MTAKRTVIYMLTIIAFVLEVINPSTAFVREQLAPIHHFQLTCVTVPHGGSSHSLPNKKHSGVDEYATCSAVPISNFVPPRPISYSLAPALPIFQARQTVRSSLQRPPAMS